VKELREKGSIHDWEQDLHKKSGEVFVAHLSAQILTVRGEDLILSASLDITRRKRAEVEREKLIMDLEAANNELESFSYSVSHDLRAPLRAIDGFSQMLLKDIGDRLDPESVRKFNVISHNSKKMGHLIDDLLKLSRAGRAPVHHERINMKAGVEDVWKELRAGNPVRNMELTVGELPMARGDKTLIRQVLSNLLSNAVKFTKNKDKAEIEVSGSNSGDFNVYCIKDNGIGFDMRYYDKVFEIFHRLHNEREYEGTGVGLAIVKKIIERHGGRLWAESKPGEGATFYFTLPA
jgi:two-component system sensor kinase